MIHASWGRCLLQLLYTLRKSLKDLYFSEFSGWAFETAGYQGSEGWRLVELLTGSCQWSPPPAQKKGEIYENPTPGRGTITYPTLGKVKSSSKYLWQEGYVSSQEGKISSIIINLFEEPTGFDTMYHLLHLQKCIWMGIC